MEQCEGETLTIFEHVRVNGALTLVTLSVDGTIRWTESSERCLTVEEEVLGFSVEGSRIMIRAFVERESGGCCVGSRRIRVRKDFVFESSSEESLRLWCLKLQESIDSLDRPKRLFIFVNPFGGKRSASKIFHDEVKPLLEAADIQFTIQETQYQLHAKEIAQTFDLSKYDGIVCVSGDGILVEVVNGLLQRDDWDSAIKIPLGIIPAGTGNGMVKSLMDSVDDPCSVSNATLAVIRELTFLLHVYALSCVKILQPYACFVHLCFIYVQAINVHWTLLLSCKGRPGLVADIDIESEKYRWMGSSRLDFYALLRIIHLRKYTGRVSFVPAPGYEAYGELGHQKVECTSKLDISCQSQEDTVKVQQHGYRGPSIFLENLEWRTIDGPFVSFSDGSLDLIIIRDCPKSSLLMLMAKLNDGSHVKSPYVLYLKVKAFILEPGQRSEDPMKGGIIDSDGEVLARGEGTYKCEQKDLMAYETIQMTVDQGLATLFSPR
ncbi:hypothetical protein HHK36_001967 [Tetracentron sinense]|uniref:sphingosine kinase n=1 Tax=Tetracentron sinense TaxID=13715 RepID=A0A834ZY78_TETSI|nr:hypothetical protein HHK36_001967 [Tetracentron sinense]